METGVDAVPKFGTTDSEVSICVVLPKSRRRSSTITDVSSLLLFVFASAINA